MAVISSHEPNKSEIRETFRFRVPPEIARVLSEQARSVSSRPQSESSNSPQPDVLEP